MLCMSSLSCVSSVLCVGDGLAVYEYSLLLRASDSDIYTVLTTATVRPGMSVSYHVLLSVRPSVWSHMEPTTATAIVVAGPSRQSGAGDGLDSGAPRQQRAPSGRLSLHDASGSTSASDVDPARFDSWLQSVSASGTGAAVIVPQPVSVSASASHPRQQRSMSCEEQQRIRDYFLRQPLTYHFRLYHIRVPPFAASFARHSTDRYVRHSRAIMEALGQGDLSLLMSFVDDSTELRVFNSLATCPGFERTRDPFYGPEGQLAAIGVMLGPAFTWLNFTLNIVPVLSDQPWQVKVLLNGCCTVRLSGSSGRVVSWNYARFWIWDANMGLIVRQEYYEMDQELADSLLEQHQHQELGFEERLPDVPHPPLPFPPQNHTQSLQLSSPPSSASDPLLSDDRTWDTAAASSDWWEQQSAAISLETDGFNAAAPSMSIGGGQRHEQQQHCDNTTINEDVSLHVLPSQQPHLISPDPDYSALSTGSSVASFDLSSCVNVLPSFVPAVVVTEWDAIPPSADSTSPAPSATSPTVALQYECKLRHLLPGCAGTVSVDSNHRRSGRGSRSMCAMCRSVCVYRPLSGSGQTVYKPFTVDRARVLCLTIEQEQQQRQHSDTNQLSRTTPLLQLTSPAAALQPTASSGAVAARNKRRRKDDGTGASKAQTQLLSESDTEVPSRRPAAARAEQHTGRPRRPHEPRPHSHPSRLLHRTHSSLTRR